MLWVVVCAALVACEDVIYIQDGAIDEYGAFITLVNDKSQKRYTVLGDVMTNADSVLPWSMSVAHKIHQLMPYNPQLSLSNARGWNAFPWAYRSDPMRMDHTAPLANLSGLKPPYVDGDVWLVDTLKRAESVTIVCCTAITPLVDVLKANPSLVGKINRLIWMAGAIDVRGNLDPTQFAPWADNPYTEWNVFWDPYAVKWLFENTTFPIYLCPLDLSDKVPVTSAFMGNLSQLAERSHIARVMNASYALVAKEPFYRLWDTVTTAYLVHPEYFATPVVMPLGVNLTEPSQGRLTPVIGGRPVHVVQGFVPYGRQKFYRFVLDAFQ